VSEDETPFARVPTPGIHERPSPFTPVGEIALYGAIADGLERRPVVLRWLVVVGLVAFLLFGTLLLFVDLSDSDVPESPPAPRVTPSPTLPSTVPTLAPPP
jgi:hypothetical protein